MSRSRRYICFTRNKRDVVEKMFDTYKTVLNADKLYPQDDESVFGHVFVAFLSLYIHCKITGAAGTAEFSSEIAKSLNFTAEHTENAEAPKNISND
ncbi:hypothetical protein C5S32_09125 [ANME-1 cluster archaeon GoMg1]|nr:hypothetical protein [ANME-1 cluster archaeon GoMg1]